MSTISVERLADLFVELAEPLADDFSVVDFLQLVASRTAELVDGSTVGVLLANPHNQLRFIAATSRASKVLDEPFELEQAALLALQDEEGPCLECFHTGVPLLDVELQAGDSPWPRFAAQATGHGFRSVHAFPMRLRSEIIGALSLFGDHERRLAPTEAHLVQAVADAATIRLMQGRAVRRAQVLASQLQAALDSRIVIEQAKGAIALLHGTSVDTAFEMMRSHARTTHAQLSDVAKQVVTTHGEIAGLTA